MFLPDFLKADSFLGLRYNYLYRSMIGHTQLAQKMGVEKFDQAEDGQQALHRLKEKDYDVILMDCQMPVLDGYEATRKIRSLPEFQDLTIFALTADVDTRSREKAHELGFNKHFTKPINIVELTHSLQHLIK